MENSLNSIAHYFITDSTNRYQLGGPGYELTYAVSWVLQYLLAIPNSAFDQRKTELKEADVTSMLPLLKSSFGAIAAHEQLLVQRFLAFLTSEEQWDRGIRVVGSEASDERAPTISFVVTDGKNGEHAMKSKEVVGGVDKLGGVSEIFTPDRRR
jgi:selenocysteine lyase/cysteine desulfurase